MTTEPELDKLIIDNLADLDATAKRADVLVREIWGEVSGHLDTWAKDRGWVTPQDPDNPWVTSPDWVQGKTYDAWFSVAWGPRDNGKGEEGEAYFDLSRFAGVGGGRLCLWLGFHRVNRSVWKPLLRDAASNGNAGGFSFDDAEGFYLDCTPPSGSLAAAVADNDFADAFAPLTRALDAAHAAWPLFDALLKKARA